MFLRKPSALGHSAIGAAAAINAAKGKPAPLVSGSAEPVKARPADVAAPAKPR